ncbi:hypothetical protein V6N12_055130 [Hibiscus sabdariffa]|uniref:Uncharacterized protein n=1 Tax=Hibiscus sabdariffa TaxID=183260 RepID=A0ABR2ANG2_9ROSI
MKVVWNSAKFPGKQKRNRPLLLCVTVTGGVALHCMIQVSGMVTAGNMDGGVRFKLGLVALQVVLGALRLLAVLICWKAKRDMANGFTVSYRRFFHQNGNGK